MNPKLLAAAEALKRGEPVLVYDGDGREEETDFIISAPKVTWQQVRQLRNDGGGLICLALGPAVHQGIGLPYLTDVVADNKKEYPILAGLLPDDIKYDQTKPAFGLTINHRKTFTGITDQDRAKTMARLGEYAQAIRENAPLPDLRRQFQAEFRSPGHVHLLNGQPKGLAARQGHTELSIELMRLAKLPEAAVLCEMMDNETGGALKRKDAEAYALKHGYVYLSGKEIMEAWKAQ